MSSTDSLPTPLYDEQMAKSPEFEKMCRGFVEACTEIQFPKPVTPNEDSSRISKLQELYTHKIKVNSCVKLEDRLNYFKLSYPRYKKLLLKTKGMDPLLDSIFVYSNHKIPNKQLNSGNKTMSEALVPIKSIHFDGEFTIKTSEVVIVMRNQWVSTEEEREPSFQIYGLADDTETDGLITTYQICLQVLINQTKKLILTKPKDRSLNEESSERDVSESIQLSLNVVLDSKLFNQGFSQEKFTEIDKKPQETLMGDKRETPAELGFHYFDYFTSITKMNPIVKSKFDTLCLMLQSNTHKHSIHSNLMGQSGFAIVKAAFLVILYHLHQLSVVEFVDTQDTTCTLVFERIWIEISKLRVHCRKFESDEQFEGFFRKMILLLSLNPAEETTEKSMELPMVRKESMDSNPLRTVKTIYEDLKLKKFAKSKVQISSIPELVIKFLTLEIEADQVVTIISGKQSKFKAFGQAINEIQRMICDDNKPNSEDALNFMNQILRKNDCSLDYFSIDYAGLSKADTEKRIGDISQMMSAIVDSICCIEVSPSTEHTILIALESLKWKWRSKEMLCVTTIDIEAMLSSNSSLLSYPAIVSSLIELGGILLGSVANKFKDGNQASASYIPQSGNILSSSEENQSLQEFANKNLHFFVSILQKSVNELKLVKYIDAGQHWDLWSKKSEGMQRNRVIDFARWYIEDKCNDNSEPLDMSGKIQMPYLESDIGAIDDAFKIVVRKEGINILENKPAGKPVVASPNKDQSKEDKAALRKLKKEKKKQDSPAVSLGGLFDDPIAYLEPKEQPKQEEKEQEEESDNELDEDVVKVAKRVMTLKELGDLLTQTFGEGNSKLGYSISHSLKTLTHLYVYIQSAQDLVGLFFEENTTCIETIKELALGEYPLQIKCLAIKLLILVQNNFAGIFTFDEPSINTLVETVLPDYLIIAGKPGHTFRDPLVKQAILGCLQSIMLSSASTDVFSKVLKELVDSDLTEKSLLALDILDLNSVPIQPGSIVIEKGDPMNEQYLVLPKKGGLEGKAYLREWLNIKYDLKLSDTTRKEELSKRSVSHAVLAMCLRTRHYRFFQTSKIEAYRGYFDKERFITILDQVQIFNIVNKVGTSNAGLFVLAKLSSILVAADSTKFIPIIKIIEDKIPKGISLVAVGKSELNTFISSYLEKVVTKSIKGVDSHSVFEPLGDYKDNEAHIPISSKFQELRKQFYNSINNIRGRPPGLESAKNVTTTINFNIYHYGLTPLPHSPAVALADVKLRSVLASLIKLDLIGLLARKTPSADLISASIPLSICDDLINRLPKPINQLNPTVPIKSILDNPVNDLLTDQINNRILRANADEVGALRYDIMNLAQILPLLGNLTNRNWFLVMRVLESIERIMLALPKAKDISETLGKNHEVLSSISTIFSLLSFIPGLSSGSAGKRHKIEYFENLHFGLCRLMLQHLKPSRESMSTPDTFDWLTQVNHRLSQVCRSDTEADDLIIKTILTTLLVQDKIDDNRFITTMKAGSEIQKIDLSKYVHWMYTNKEDSKAISFSISSDKEGKNKIVVYEKPNQDYTGDLSMGCRFSTKPGEEYFMRPDFIKDYFLSDKLSQLSNIMNNERVTNSPYPTASLLNCMLISGKLFLTNNGTSIVMDHISLAKKLTSNCALYRETTKELFIQCQETNQECYKYPYVLYFSDSSRGNPYFCVDLSSVPKLSKIICVIKDQQIMALTENDQLLYVNVDTNKNNYSTIVIRRALAVLFENRRAEITGQIILFPQPANFKVTHVSAPDDNMVYFGLKMAGGSKIFQWTEGDCTAHFIEFAGETITKMEMYRSALVVLFESGKVYKREWETQKETIY